METRPRGCILGFAPHGAHRFLDSQPQGLHENAASQQMSTTPVRSGRAQQDSGGGAASQIQTVVQGLEQGLQYPPASFEKVIQALFLNGSASDSSWRLKLTLLLYYLLDVGHKALLNSFG